MKHGTEIISESAPSPFWKRIKLNKAPPVRERPKCPTCGKALQPWWDRVTTGNARMGWTESLTWNDRYHGYGAFCTLRCCETFANAAVKAGYVLRRK